MGVADDLYPEFKKFNKWVIKDPIKEINKVMDFYLENDDFFAAGIRLAIKAEHIDKFAEIDSYQQRIEKIESQIMQLKAKLCG